MIQENLGDTLRKTAHHLFHSGTEMFEYIPKYGHSLPSMDNLKEIVELLRAILFPGYFGKTITKTPSLTTSTDDNLVQLYELLFEQVHNGLCFNLKEDSEEVKVRVGQMTLDFIQSIPEIRRLLSTDVRATYNADPAAKNIEEIIFCYPTIRAMINHRFAHQLLKLQVPLLPRIISEMAHSETGIDIHPGAVIGEYFCIDHGTGVVIGETCIIGNNVRLYQGVTLGAKKFSLDDSGNPLKDEQRHPIIEDNVVIYSNANILGRVVVGKNSVIGGNVWITNDVPANSKITQAKVVQEHFFFGSGI
ncbi:MAG: serine acetyltransferase [Leptospiraceae bacterium]|nr:serine acetyltransferase [Leptospiraceae bacterium]